MLRNTAFVFVCLLLVLPARPQSVADGAQQFASIGDLKLRSGEVLRDCRIGYRTFGQMNADQSNVIVLTTWFNGNSASMASNYVGHDKAFDPGSYFIVIIDALADGVSSSPSNGDRQKYPEIRISDMVESQHRLLTGTLHIRHVFAIGGASMGGMQTFQWLVQYPEFMERAVAVVGTPRQTSHDLLLWNAMLHATLNDPGYRNGVHSLPALASEISDMELTTPEYRVQHTPPDQFASFLSGVDRGNDRLDADNVIRQLGAMLKHDISADFGESMERAAAAVKARVLIITALQDHMVNPIPALAFVPLVNAKELELSSNCGHLAPGCEMPKVIEAIRGFLAAK